MIDADRVIIQTGDDSNQITFLGGKSARRTGSLSYMTLAYAIAWSSALPEINKNLNFFKKYHVYWKMKCEVSGSLQDPVPHDGK